MGALRNLCVLNCFLGIFFGGSIMGEWLECKRLKVQVPPSLAASSIICSQLGPELNSLATLLNS